MNHLTRIKTFYLLLVADMSQIFVIIIVLIKLCKKKIFLLSYGVAVFQWITSCTCNKKCYDHTY